MRHEINSLNEINFCNSLVSQRSWNLCSEFLLFFNPPITFLSCSLRSSHSLVFAFCPVNDELLTWSHHLKKWWFVHVFLYFVKGKKSCYASLPQLTGLWACPHLPFHRFGASWHHLAYTTHLTNYLKIQALFVIYFPLLFCCQCESFTWKDFL